MGKDFNLPAQLTAFARANDVPLTDPNITERFAADIAPRLQAAIKDRNLVYGMRTERLFEAMVVSPGKLHLRYSRRDKCTFPNAQLGSRSLRLSYSHFRGADTTIKSSQSAR